MTAITESTGAIPTLEPATAEELAAMLRRAADARQSILIRGAGTKMHWGRNPGRIDAILSTRRLNRVLAHQHGDLTATIEAGATLGEVNDTLAREGQCLPLDPPFAEQATIGGIVATNDSGPLRHRFGTPRDLVIGVQLATTDGVIAKAGGQVVKNVAGYDLSKLVCGSFGSLAAIVSATFKLTPLPSASKTITIDVPDVDTLGRVVGDVISSQLEPIAFDVGRAFQASRGGLERAGPQLQLLLRFASLSAVVDAQVTQTLELTSVKGCETTVTGGDAERSLWERYAQQFWNEDGAIVRASWLPAELPVILRGFAADDMTLAGRAAIGAGLIRIGGDVQSQATAIDRLRRSPLRNVVVVRGSDELKSLVDVWGPMGDRERLLVALKCALDPNNVLNAGRGPL